MLFFYCNRCFFLFFLRFVSLEDIEPYSIFIFKELNTTTFSFGGIVLLLHKKPLHINPDLINYICGF